MRRGYAAGRMVSPSIVPKGSFNPAQPSIEALLAAPEGKSGYGPFRSANGVLGAGPDCVIVDGDWLMARLNELTEFTGKRYGN